MRNALDLPAVQAIVVPRGFDPADAGRLRLCVVFGVSGAAAGAAAVWADWPATADRWLRSATLDFGGGVTSEALRRYWPDDLAGWDVGQSQAAWAAVFAGVPFGGAAAPVAAAAAAARTQSLKSLYAKPDGTPIVAPAVGVNPDAASEFNPANTIESPNPASVGQGMAAAAAARRRAADPAARRDFDARYAAALAPADFDRTMAAFRTHVAARPDAYPAAVAAAVAAAAGGTAALARRPAGLDAWAGEHWEAVLAGFVGFRLAAAQTAAAVEVRRIGRQMRAGRNRESVDADAVTQQLKKPTFAQLMARVRHYPGLARRLSLVVHASVKTPANLPATGAVRLTLAAGEWSATPTTAYAVKDKAYFRARPKEPTTFAPGGPTLFYHDHVFDPALYAATQQDLLQAAAQAAAAQAAVPATAPAPPVPPPEPPFDPPPAVLDDVDAVLKSHRNNAVLFVARPQVVERRAADEGTPPSAAEALDARLRASAAAVPRPGSAGDLYAEDLMAGVTVFARRAAAAGAKPADWHSLCRRVVHITASGGPQPLRLSFEDEGTVASGTLLTVPPVVGLVIKSTAPVPPAPTDPPNPPDPGTEGEVRLYRLLTGNGKGPEEPLRLAPTARFHGDFRPYLTAENLKPGDIAHLTLGGVGGTYTDVEVVPLMTAPAAAVDKAGFSVVIADATNQGKCERPGERFAVGLSPTLTHVLDETGKPVDYAKFAADAKAAPTTFFVEGKTRLILAGPKFPLTDPLNPPVSYFNPLVAGNPAQPPAAGAVLVHEAVPPAVLRTPHLRPADGFTRLNLTAPDAAGAAKLAEAYEVTAALGHVRGVVTRLGFELTATLRPAPAPPTQLFVTIAGKAWEVQFDGPGVDAPAPGDAKAPKLFDGQVSGKIVERAFDAAAAALLPPAGDFGDAAFRVAMFYAVFGAYSTDTTAGGLSLALDPRLAAGARVPTAAELRVRLAGAAEVSVSPEGNRVVALVASALELLAERAALTADATFGLTWLPAFRDGQLPEVRVAYDLAVTDSRGKKAYYDPAVAADKAFVHPADAVGFVLDAVTTGAGPRAGRAWPQALPGTFHGVCDPTQALQAGAAGGGVAVATRAPQFATPDGFRVTHVVRPAANDPQAETGYFLVYPLGRPRSGGVAVTSARLAAKLPALLSDRRPSEAAVFGGARYGLPQLLADRLAGYDADADSSLVWNADPTRSQVLPLVAEVAAVGPAVIDLIVAGGGAAGFRLGPTANATDGVFRPPVAALPPRRLSELKPGELVLANGTLEPFPPPDAPLTRSRFTVAALPGTAFLDLAATVRGTYEPSPLSDAEQAAEGPGGGRAVLRTRNGAAVVVWYDAGRTTTPARGAEVAAVATPVLSAETLSLWKVPVPAAADGSKAEPVNALATDLIAKWANWSLAVRMPGAADDPPAAGAGSDTLHIACDRRHGRAGRLAADIFGPWGLPPLRFDKKYEFLVRRADLAGNHVYDERKPASGIAAAAVQTLKPLAADDPAVQVLAGGRAAGDGVFGRADLPLPAPLAFPAGRPNAAWRPADPARPPPRLPPEFRLVAYQREPLLILFSDVYGRAVPAADDAFSFLLPPPAPVETVLMHGRFDGYPPEAIPDVICQHERHAAQGVLAADGGGGLNYFGDPQVVKYRVDFVSRQADVPPPVPTAEHDVVQAAAFAAWPAAAPVELRVVAVARTAARGGRNPAATGPLTAAALADLCTVDAGPDCARPVVHAVLPPGGYGAARVLPVVAPGGPAAETAYDVGQRVRVLHVVNGPVHPPRWVELGCATGPNDTGFTSHHVTGKFTLDVPTAGTYALAGYWNECWDEALPYGWEEAALPLPADPARLAATTTIGKEAGGYGYGSEAVVQVTVKSGAIWPADARLPAFAATVAQGRVERIDVVDSGRGWGGLIDVRVLRRPPLFRVAAAEVRRAAAGGPLAAAEVVVTDPGGWYAASPFAIVFDRGGTGYGAVARAVLNGQGGVGAVTLDAAGDRYSADVEVRFYTHRRAFAEQEVPMNQPSTETSLDGPGPALHPHQHPFGDARNRRVDYAVTAQPRHAEFLLPPTADGRVPAGDPVRLVRTPVPRTSDPLPLQIPGTARPATPQVAFPLLAFHWRCDDGGAAPVADPTRYFLRAKTGRLRLTRTEAIRVYLRRPWHQSGAEMLGVVVAPAVLNSVRIDGDLTPGDGGVVNRFSEYPNDAGPKNALAGEVLPSELRGLVSRWGFDPVWPERALPPLSAGHFPRALADVAYETLSDATGKVERLANLLPHEVHYDAAKNLWYADVVVDLRDLGRRDGARPFVRLNLVTYRKHGLPGLTASAVVATDPVPVGGERQLVVARPAPGRFEFALAGDFPSDPPAGRFPRRRVVAELQHRDPALPPEVELLLKPAERFDHARHVAHEVELAWHAGTRNYRGVLELSPATQAALGAGRAAVVVREEEFYRTLAAQPSGTGDRTVVVDDVACAVRTPSAYTFLI